LPGETLWTISQRFGVQIKKLRRYNRLSSYEEVSAGTMLWLASTRPKSDPAAKQVENAVAVSNDETFNWSATSQTKPSADEKDSIELPATTIKQDIPVVSARPEIEEEPKVLDSLKTLPEPAIAESPLPDTLQAPPEIIAPKKTTHTVQAGETLYGIAKMYSLGVMDLVNWNDLDLKQGIKPGLILRLSENQPVKSEPIALKTQELVHEVRSSDTLYSIARLYGVTIKEIMDWNEKKDFSLAVGEKLKILHRQ